MRIRLYTEEVVRTKCKPVTNFGPTLEGLVNNMKQAMKENPTLVALAANQIGYDRRVILLGWENPTILVNPEIISQSEEMMDSLEGCGSIPGLWVKIKRPREVEVKYQNMVGHWFNKKFKDDLNCRALSHELDHLNGVTLFDREIQVLSNPYKYA